MGIRFLCPNGHKLNVKSFLAGRRGICPYCHERFLIPDQSAPGVRVAASGRGSGAEKIGLPRGVDVDLRDPEANSDIGPGDSELSSEPAPAIATDRADDPLTTSASTTWYVRKASGDQLGPTNTETVQAWVNDGRVGEGCLVWRDGWSDWQPASQVFHSGNRSGIAADFDFDPAMLLPAGGTDAPAETEVRTEPIERPGVVTRLSQPSQRTVQWIFAGLGVLVLVLVPVMIYVLFYHHG